ncbi:hypothetical protein [Flavobacterium sp. HJJ]|uniref:hypothetical protein n=1 Tax=Flavobacterium sp. HJJ TaxID=2783792 RepID=UPI00188DC063|nr:hypothetical protein [Flavobacterium sp. HJJ]MBF4469915.1 hypothetical protein [Flavobacterium sp. HJJ]
MSNKIGIYITGLGQSIDNETVEKYSERLKNELSFKTTGYEYSIKTKKILYQPEKESTVVSIVKKDKKTNAEEVIYKMYDFQYHKILTDKFNQYNILFKTLILSVLVIKKIPQIILRMVNSNGFDRPYQTFYAFFIIFLISLSVLFLVPSAVSILTIDNKADQENISAEKKQNITVKKAPQKKIVTTHKTTLTDKLIAEESFKDFIDRYSKTISESINHYIENIRTLGQITLPITTLLLVLIPQSKTIITSLSTEFACVDAYINNGEQSQILLGNLDLLVEYIAENEPDPEIHFHTYSFGSILAIDALFPIAEIPPSDNIQNLTKLLITTGNPFEFINAYYPSFYNRRSETMKDSLKWINIYSVSDVFATNYRCDANRGEAEFGIKNVYLLPENINYEITSDKAMNPITFLSLSIVKMHKCYWDPTTIGQSCMKVLLPSMIKNKFISA